MINLHELRFRAVHPLKLCKLRFDLFLNYLRAFGLVGGVRTLCMVRFSSRKKGEEIGVRIRRTRPPVWLRYGTSDVPAFEKIFVWKQYDVGGPEAASYIIDCGGNIGLSAWWFAEKYPRAKVYALEPDSENFRLLMQNVGTLENVFPLQCGVWTKVCKIVVSDPSVDPDSYSFREADGDSMAGTDAIDLDSLIEREDIPSVDLLKIDVEGAEAALFGSGQKDWHSKARWMVIEIHGDECRRCVESVMCKIPHSHFTRGENDVYVQKT